MLLTSKSNVAGSASALNLALGPNVSGADQCCALLNGLPRTSKLQDKTKENIYIAKVQSIISTLNN